MEQPIATNFDKDFRVKRLYKRLKLTPEDAKTVPQISPILAKVGGRDKIVEYLRGVDDDDARKVLKLIDQNETIADCTPIEIWCLAAGITTRRMFELVAGAVFEQSGQMAELLVRSRYPEITEATLNYAMTPGGTREREMIHKHTGFLPVPKTQFVNVHGNQNIDARQQTAVVLPPMEAQAKRLSDRFNEKMLGAVPVTALPEAPLFVEEDEESDDGTDMGG